MVTAMFTTYYDMIIRMSILAVNIDGLLFENSLRIFEHVEATTRRVNFSLLSRRQHAEYVKFFFRSTQPLRYTAINIMFL